MSSNRQINLVGYASGNASSNVTSLSSSANDDSFPTGPFSFIIPYKQTQACDIYGPLCQTGSIAVAVNKTSIIVTTTVPCSSYLTAQAAYLSAFEPHPGAIFPFWPDDWASSFGYSPQCTSYAEVWQRGGQYTFSNCGSSNTIIQASAPSAGIALPTQIPPGVLRAIPPAPHEVYECCGNCSLDVPQVRLYYFPDNAAPQCQGNQTNNSTAAVSGRRIDRREFPHSDMGSIAILSGHTFTSPSIYLEVVGTAAMADQCGPLGSTLTNPFITLAPGALSTYVPQDYQIGSTYIDEAAAEVNIFMGTVKPLNIPDLQCPSFGIGIGTSADGSVHTTVGPPWLPVIVPPPEAFSLDPSWESFCTGLLSFAPGMISFAIYDPPRALSVASDLVAPPSEVPPATTPSNVLANPTATLDPPTLKSGSPATPPSSPINPIAPPPESPPGSQGPSNAQIGPDRASARPAAVPLDPAAKATVGPETSTPIPSSSPPQAGIDPHSEASGLGALIFGALGKTDPPARGSASPVSVLQLPESGIKEVTVGGQVLTVNPSGVIFDRTSYSIGGPAISLSSNIISLVPASTSGEAPGNGYEEIPVPGSGVREVTVGGQVISISPSGVVLDGTSYSVGGPAISLSGGIVSLVPESASGKANENGYQNIAVPGSGVREVTAGNQVLSIGPSGVLFDGISYSVGGPAISLPGAVVSLTPSSTIEKKPDHGDGPATNTKPLTSTIGIIAGHTVVSTPSGLAIDGLSLLPGGSPITISNTVISLSPSDVLVVGSSSVVLPPQSMSEVGHFLPGPHPAGFVVGDSTIRFADGGHTLTVDGLTIQAESTGILVDGIALQPGGTGPVVHGGSVSLNQGGTLDIGPSPPAMPTRLANGTWTLPVFEGSQTRACGLPWLYLLAGLSVSVVRVMAS